MALQQLARTLGRAGAVVLAAAGFVVAARVTLPALEPAPTAPDIVLAVWDTARADHSSVYGYPRETTPNLARLAAQAVVYEQAIAPAPWTVPSMASLFTGLFVQRHGVSLDPEVPVLDLPPAATTLAEALARAGYETAAFTEQGIYDAPGFRRGFDRFEVVGREQLLERADGFLSRARTRPALVLVHWLDPHAPYRPVAAHRAWSARWARPVNLSGAGRSEDFAPAQQAAGWLFKDDVNEGRVSLTVAQWSQLVDQYDGELRQTDAALGRLWDGVLARGQQRRTLLAVVADHGEGFGEHAAQRVWHDHPYDTILRVPLVVRWPGGSVTGRVRSQVGTLDLFATLLEAAGVALPGGLDSRPLPRRDESARPRPLLGASHYVGGVTWYRDAELKLIEYRRAAPLLFDLRVDPGERRDLAASRPDLLADARARRDAAQAQAGAALPFAAKAEADRLERLRALGYVR
jgi:arylsulfatase A-like enzyme